MKPALEKYGPPVLVLGAALYLGWPPAEPMDLGENLVTAKSVRWKSSDLEPPRAPEVVVDPFRAVLLVTEKPETAAAVDTVVEPLGPSDEEIRSVMVLNGVAKSGGRSWAIVNGRVRLAGDLIPSNSKIVPDCSLVSIHEDHVVVSCGKKLTVIRPQVSRPANKRNLPATTAEVPPAEDQPLSVPPAPDVDTSPQA